MSKINTVIPEFTAQAFHNGEFKTVTTDDVKGKWAIFMFYPADFTFVCPTELEDMANHYDELQKMDVEVYSVSTDTHFVHKAWHDASIPPQKIKTTISRTLFLFVKPHFSTCYLIKYYRCIRPSVFCSLTFDGNVGDYKRQYNH